MKLNVFGRIVQAERREGQWQIFYLGVEGKRRKAEDIEVPPFIKEEELLRYIADLCHEWATRDNPDVIRLDPEDL